MSGGVLTPDAVGRLDAGLMIAVGTGNWFKLQVLAVRPSGIVRLSAPDVPDASFPADSHNGVDVPPYGPLPAQTYDVKASCQPGTYYFQWDARAALGMVGRITVEPKG